jgi:hypothetical protein
MTPPVQSGHKWLRTGLRLTHNSGTMMEALSNAPKVETMRILNSMCGSEAGSANEQRKAILFVKELVTLQMKANRFKGKQQRNQCESYLHHLLALAAQIPPQILCQETRNF